MIHSRNMFETILLFVHLGIKKMGFFGNCMYRLLKFRIPRVYQILKGWTPENDEHWLISQIMDMNFISIKKHEIEML